MTGAWLPITHGAEYKKVKNDIDNLGPHIDKEAKLGLVVLNIWTLIPLKI